MIFLQRHGESTANTSEIYACRRLDPELTERGRSQVEANAIFYGDVGIRRILSSPSKRAAQTAEIIGSVLGLTREVNAVLMEVNVGDFEGQSYHSAAYSSERFFSIFEDWLVRQKDTRFPGGESRQDVEERLQEMESLLSPCPTILVGHGGLFACFLGRRMRFESVKELFLSRAGIAYCCAHSREWVIKKRI